LTILPTRELADTGLAVSVLGLGGAGLGELFETIEEDRAQDIVSTAWAGGIRFYDTAPWYGHGMSEHRMGHFLRQQDRDQYALSTKVGRLYRPASSPAYLTPPWVGGLPFELHFDYSYDGIMRSWEDSLMRLGLNRVETLVIHDLDSGYHGTGDVIKAHKQALESSGWKALEELKGSGQIRAIGAGINADAMIPYFLESFDMDFMLVAMPYTLLDQEPLEDILPACINKGVSVVIGSPYASGILATGPVEGALYNYAPADSVVLQKTRDIKAVCDSHGVSLQAAAMQFPLGHASVISVIPGATASEHVSANVANLTAEIPDSLWTDLKNEQLLVADAPVPTMNGKDV
jgi:D-threo-aldose 1-dehydrogenase